VACGLMDYAAGSINLILGTIQHFDNGSIVAVV
jgi:hypothetical protein